MVLDWTIRVELFLFTWLTLDWLLIISVTLKSSWRRARLCKRMIKSMPICSGQFAVSSPENSTYQQGAVATLELSQSSCIKRIRVHVRIRSTLACWSIRQCTLRLWSKHSTNGAPPPMGNTPKRRVLSLPVPRLRISLPRVSFFHSMTAMRGKLAEFSNLSSTSVRSQT